MLLLHECRLRHCKWWANERQQQIFNSNSIQRNKNCIRSSEDFREFQERSTLAKVRHWSRKLIRLQFYGGQLIFVLLNLSATVAHLKHKVNQSNIRIVLRTKKNQHNLFLIRLKSVGKCKWQCVRVSKCACVYAPLYIIDTCATRDFVLNAPTCNWVNTSKVATISYACKCVFRLFFWYFGSC